MSNVNREQPRDRLSDVLEFVLQQWAKASLHTAVPGLIETYDAETRRARIRIALRLVMTTETPGQDGEAMERAPLVNVPVIFPAGGGLTMLFPLQAGDPVLVVFSERGLTDFKTTHDLATPDAGHFFAETDAMALAGFGPLTLTPASQTGATLQTEDGDTYVEVEATRIRLYRGQQEVEVDDAKLRANIQGDIEAEASGDIDATAGGTATVTAPNIVLDGRVRITGELTVEANTSVQGNIAVTGTVDGVDVSTHRHPAGNPPGSTGPPL